MFEGSVAKLGENEWQIAYLMPLPTSKASVVGPGAVASVEGPNPRRFVAAGVLWFSIASVT